MKLSVGMFVMLAGCCLCKFSALAQTTNADDRSPQNSRSQNSQTLKVDQSLDHGIYLQHNLKGQAMCGAIVSYNFSRGENPYLQSVTSCTPSHAVELRRAGQHENSPRSPTLRRAVLGTPSSGN